MSETLARGKLSDDVRDKLLAAFQLGASATVAARYAGIHPSTLRRWIKLGLDEPDGPYGEFAIAVSQAQAGVEIEVLRHMSKHMEKHWNACMAFFERRFPNRWHKRARSTRKSLPKIKTIVPAFDENHLREVACVLEETDVKLGGSTVADAALDERDSARADAETIRFPVIAAGGGALRWGGGRREE